MKVSVIIPFYNDGLYIDSCLRSVSIQSHWDLECLLVDDCGTDDAAQIALGFATVDSRFSIIKHPQNLGQAAARNTALKRAQGEYIYFMDADDRLFDDKSLELLIDKAVQTGADWVQGAYYRSNDTVAQYGNDTYRRDGIIAHFNKLNFTNVAGKLVNREFIEKNQLYFTEGLTYEDTEWNLRAYAVVQEITNVQQPTYFHNLRPDSIMRSDFTKQKVESIVTILDKFADKRNDKNISSVLIYKALFLLKNLLMGHFGGAYKRQVYKSIRGTLNIRPDLQTLPPFTKMLARVRKNYLLSNLLCRAYRCSR